MANWSFITNHGLVLASIAKHPDKTAREIGDEAHITERTAHKIISDLSREGYITKVKVGVQNKYTVNPDLRLKRSDASVGELLMMLGWERHQRPVKTESLQKVN